jgi:hypothetical protein
MKTVPYSQIQALAADLAGRPRDKLPTSEATMLRAFFAEELPDLWTREAWPELCDNIEAVTLDDESCFSLRERTEIEVLGTGLYEDVGGDYLAFFTLETGREYLYLPGNEVKLAHNNISNPAVASGLFTAEGTQYVVQGTAVGLAVTTQIFTTDEMGDIHAIIMGGNPMLTNLVTVLPRENWSRLDDRVNVRSLSGTLYVDWQTPAPDLLDNTALGIANDAALQAYELPARFKLPLAARGAAMLLAEEDPAQAGVLRGLAEMNMARQVARISRPWWRG